MSKFGGPTLEEARKAMLADKQAPKSVQEEVEQDTPPVEPEVPAVEPLTLAEQIVAPPKEPVAKKWFREIDLGDGSGKQRFEGNTQAELVDALAQAQTHATRKIRELNKKIKLATPQANMSESEKVTADKLAQLEMREAAINFRDAHPEYWATPKNYAALTAFLETRNWPGTFRNLEIALDELTDDGLLEVKTEPTKQDAPVVEAIPPTVRKRGSSGLKPEHSSSVQDDVDTPSGEPTVEELRKMPLSELRRIANRERMAQKAQR
jgi:hypothetical protein